jgi:hypothetical protein
MLGTTAQLTGQRDMAGREAWWALASARLLWEAVCSQHDCDS